MNQFSRLAINILQTQKVAAVILAVVPPKLLLCGRSLKLAETTHALVVMVGNSKNVVV